jgi:teichuronic acid biosynthesis glycosyltransferase TuaG
MTSAPVSVIMPAYNTEKFIRRSILSVLAQTHASLELIVVDDCSSDATLQVVDELRHGDARIRIVRQPVNGGVAAARNAGIDAAQGSFIAFLDSDDWWHPRKLEWQLADMQRSGAQISYTTYDRVTEDGSLLGHVQPPSSTSYADMLRSNRIGHSTGLYDRRLGDARFKAMGHEDYAFWLELIQRAGHARRVQHAEPLAWYLVRNDSVSSDKYKAARWQWRIYRDIAKLGHAASALHMCHYAWHALSKRR